jgi:glycerophosphoryl diester phosphodiesterase
VAAWADLVNPNRHELDAGYVEAVHVAGMRCMVWTVNHPRAMGRALGSDVDGVITDRPDELSRMLRDRMPIAG